HRPSDAPSHRRITHQRCIIVTRTIVVVLSTFSVFRKAFENAEEIPNALKVVETVKGLQAIK
ncbi:MAG: hypothetical protein ACUVSC_13190, partial [Candidatus Fervidibacter sp.]|uniref:hypothetical protein n=1 Tax=Candidatus Fervidibacter sp. TaxID=3100871 RepID=UPI00404A0EB4